MLNSNSRNIDFVLVIVSFFPIKLNIHSTKVEMNSSNIPKLNLEENCKGVIIAPTPSIRKILRTQEPTRFPTAKFVSFLIIAIIDVTNSGIAVPIATIVEPITISEIFKSLAIFEA